ncbi:MAG: putative ABC-type transport system permease component [Thermoleophilia bacterium]|nr:putative ABC-type transport system permease component [Thermoleophilia bacterium]
MSEFIDIWIVGLGKATIIYAAPLIFAALGGLFSERSGIVNIGLEGMMTGGAFFAIYGSDIGGSSIVGILFAVAAGMALAAIHAVATITFHADQIISGTAIVLIAAGLINFLNLNLFGPNGSPASIAVPAKVGGVSVLVLLAIAAVVVTQYVVFRTPFGLRLRSVGEHPRAADTVGISVVRYRYVGVLVSGALAGLGGAFISFNVSSYSEGMVAGNGYIALAALIIGKWKPMGCVLASLLFGLSQGLVARVHGVSPDLISMLPYVITLIVLVGFVGKSIAPAAAGKPYDAH